MGGGEGEARRCGVKMTVRFEDILTKKWEAYVKRSDIKYKGEGGEVQTFDGGD